jgi:hypothetical protein
MTPLSHTAFNQLLGMAHEPTVHTASCQNTRTGNQRAAASIMLLRGASYFRVIINVGTIYTCEATTGSLRRHCCGKSRYPKSESAPIHPIILLDKQDGQLQ